MKIRTSRQILPPEKLADFCAFPLELPKTVQDLIHIGRRDGNLIQIGGLTAADPLVGPCDPTPHPGLTERIADRTLRNTRFNGQCGMGRETALATEVGQQRLIDTPLMRRNPTKLHKSFKKDFNAEEGKHIIPTHDGRVILCQAWLSGVGTAANRPAHHAMDDSYTILIFRNLVNLLMDHLKFHRILYTKKRSNPS